MGSAGDAMEVTDNREAQRFEAEVDGLIAYAQYQLGDGEITFTHTEVPGEFRGRGIGGQLAASALEAARERGLRVKALCPFIARYINDHAEYQDLL